MLDNFTAVHYINKAWGTRWFALSAISGAIVAGCEKRDMSIEAIYLPGVLNVLADQLSRMRNESSDWKLQADIFQKTWALWEPKVDLFASAWNRQLDLFVSWKPQLEAMAVDAFSVNWINLKGCAFPPFNMMFGQNLEGSSRPDSCGTGLASATVVANHHGTSLATLADNSST
jgi:hypothetical protein